MVFEPVKFTQTENCHFSPSYFYDAARNNPSPNKKPRVDLERELSQMVAAGVAHHDLDNGDASPLPEPSQP